jgi:type II secretory pathway component PulC
MSVTVMILINSVLKQQRATLGMTVLLALGVFITLIYSFNQWHSDWQLAHRVFEGSIDLHNHDETADMIAAIPEEHIFGKSFSKTGTVPITNLGLRVTGIVKTDTDDRSSTSRAYISIAGAPSKIYQAGDSLPYGVKVYDITSDAVILENDGHLEKLPLPRNKLQFKPHNIGVHE